MQHDISEFHVEADKEGNTPTLGPDGSNVDAVKNSEPDVEIAVGLFFEPSIFEDALTQNAENDDNPITEDNVEERVSSEGITYEINQLDIRESAVQVKGQESESSGTVGIGLMGLSALGSPTSVVLAQIETLLADQQPAHAAMLKAEIAEILKRKDAGFAEMVQRKDAEKEAEFAKMVQRKEAERKAEIAEIVQRKDAEIAEIVKRKDAEREAQVAAEVSEVAAQRDYTRWASIADFKLKQLPVALETLVVLSSRICIRASLFFNQFLPSDFAGKTPCDEICRGNHGGSHEDVINGNAGQLAHMIPASYMCAKHWVPVFTILFPSHRNPRLAAEFLLFGWWRDYGEGRRRADLSGVVHNERNIVKAGNQNLTLEKIPRVIMSLILSGAVTFEDWMKEVLTGAGPSSFCLFALDRKTWVDLGFTYHAINDRVREVAGKDVSIQTSISHFNTLMTMVCKHLGQHPLEIEDKEIRKGAEGDKLRLCKLIRVFFASADFGTFPGLDAASIEEKMVICVDYEESSGKYPNPFQATTPTAACLPESSNASSPWAYPVILRSVSSALNYIHRSRKWSEWEAFFKNYCEETNRMDLFTNRENYAVVLFPGCRDFKDSEKHCLLCKAHAIAEGSVYREIPDMIYKLAVSFVHGESLSEEDLESLVQFGEEELPDNASASSEVDAAL